MSFFGRSAAPPPAPVHNEASSPRNQLNEHMPAQSPSSGSSQRAYKDLFTHQYAAVSAQTDEGLRSVKRAAAFFEHTCEAQATSAETSLKQIKSVREKYSDIKDDCTHYVQAGLMVEEVMEHTAKTIDVFAKSVINDLVKPMRVWHKAQVAKKINIDKEMNKLNDKLKLSIDEINKERKLCAAAFVELKQAATTKQTMEQQGQSGLESYSKHKGKWLKLKEATQKRFQTFESKLDNARTAQQNFYRIDVPARLTELEAIERERLQYQQECYIKFASIFSTYSTGLNQSNDLMQKVLPTLNINKAMNLLFDKWTTQFGTAPALVPVPYDLPCRWTEIQSDILDSQGGQAAQALNAPPVNMSPSAANNQSMNQSNNYSQPPPPPQQSQQYQQQSYQPQSYATPMSPAEDAHNPFAEAAASASVPAAVDGTLFMAEGLFDFDLQSEPDGDIQYLNFKAGDHINILQEGDEWWFGQLGGQQGFMPANYLRKM